MESPPNIIFFLSDDHGVGALGAYGSPHKDCTPHLDRMAGDGLRLDRAFCTNAICSPSRASVLTGKYSHRNGVTRFNTLLPDQAMLPRELQKAGYATAIFGKWHLGSNPRDLGFDQWEVLEVQGDYIDPEFRHPGGYRSHPGHSTDIITEMALSYLRNRTTPKPFFLCIHHKAPHDPFIPRPSDAEFWADRPVPLPPGAEDDWSDRSQAAQQFHREEPGPLFQGNDHETIEGQDRLENLQTNLRNYLACVKGVDESVGAVLNELDALGIAENTLIIYSSDHGMMTGEHGKIDKRMMYDSSIRLPCIFRWPAATPAGISSDDLILNIDLAPTLLEIAGAAIPEQMQGRSFAGLVSGGPIPENWRDCFYYRFYGDEPYRNIQHPPQIGVRTHQAKLIYFPETGEFEFYDLVKDPGERRNAINYPDYAETIAKLKSTISQLRRELGDEDQFAWAWTDLILPGERPGEKAYSPWPFEPIGR